MNLKEEKQEKRQFVRIEEVADILGVSYNTVWRLVKDGTIPSKRIGKAFLIPKKYLSELDIDNEKED